MFACRKQSSGTSVQDELIHVVIPLRASCCAMLGISFTKTVPAYPPRAGPCGAPRSPPRRGALPLYGQCPFGALPRDEYLLGDDPQTPDVGFADKAAAGFPFTPTPDQPVSASPAKLRVALTQVPCSDLARRVDMSHGKTCGRRSLCGRDGRHCRWGGRAAAQAPVLAAPVRERRDRGGVRGGLFLVPEAFVSAAVAQPA